MGRKAKIKAARRADREERARFVRETQGHFTSPEAFEAAFEDWRRRSRPYVIKTMVLPPPELPWRRP